ncbi:putative membrane protein [Paraburkholderia fungorum]|uniref:Membrane protein n=1 Tax=Paraburkholderia fungorum TaxID=134537 RepID=A0AAU8SWU0_9BURK|nr:putative membrane protein [Paraburkholderia fungorum]
MRKRIFSLMLLLAIVATTAGCASLKCIPTC